MTTKIRQKSVSLWNRVMLRYNINLGETYLKEGINSSCKFFGPRVRSKNTGSGIWGGKKVVVHVIVTSDSNSIKAFSQVLLCNKFIISF